MKKKMVKVSMNKRLYRSIQLFQSNLMNQKRRLQLKNNIKNMTNRLSIMRKNFLKLKYNQSIKTRIKMFRKSLNSI